MSRPHPPADADTEISISPSEGWHCSHLYYRFDRAAIKALTEAELATGRSELAAVLDPQSEASSKRSQTSIVSGGEADFSLMLMDPDPLVIDSVHQRLLATALGPAIIPGYSFVSITEISEYVPSVQQYGERLVAEGEEKDGPGYNAKLKAYEGRLVGMNRQRLTPEFPAWPSTCFYPMNKKRKVGENWFLLDSAERNRMMSEHARSGMKFAGKATQLITVGLGLDDWEWGVTLWGRRPEFLTQIVYKMRFDEASARYAEFGPFYMSYVTTPAKMLEHCQV